MKTGWIIGAAVAGALVIGGGAAYATTMIAPTDVPGPTVSPTYVVSDPAPTITPTPEVSVISPAEIAPVSDPVAPPPVLCPEGTIAGAVDDAGNESACAPLNDEGQQCAAYDDQNNCTVWYRP